MSVQSPFTKFIFVNPVFNKKYANKPTQQSPLQVVGPLPHITSLGSAPSHGKRTSLSVLPLVLHKYSWTLQRYPCPAAPILALLLQHSWTSGSLLTQHIPKISQIIYTASAHTAQVSRICGEYSLITHLLTHPFSIYIQHPYTLPIHRDWKQEIKAKHLTLQKSQTGKSQLYPNYMPQFHTLSLRWYIQQKQLKNVMYMDRS